jgi:hypothetical protein
MREIPDLFDGIDLTDSWVLNIEASPRRVVMTVDFSLQPSHRRYHPPLPGDYAYYERGRLSISGVDELWWRHQPKFPARDVTGEIDYGNIDNLEMTANSWIFEGSLGTLTVTGEPLPVIEISFDEGE